MFRIVLEITAVPPYCNAITTVLQCDSHSRSNQVIVRSQIKCVSAAATAAAPLGASAAVRCPVGCAGCCRERHGDRPGGERRFEADPAPGTEVNKGSGPRPGAATAGCPPAPPGPAAGAEPAWRSGGCPAPRCPAGPSGTPAAMGWGSGRAPAEPPRALGRHPPDLGMLKLFFTFPQCHDFRFPPSKKKKASTAQRPIRQRSRQRSRPQPWRSPSPRGPPRRPGCARSCPPGSSCAPARGSSSSPSR